MAYDFVTVAATGMTLVKLRLSSMARSEVFDICAMLGVYPSREWLYRHLQLGRKLSIAHAPNVPDPTVEERV